MAETQKDQQHPLWSRDRQIINTLLAETPTDYNLAELARLRIRYRGFPGARDLQADLDKVLKQWNLTDETLTARTRQIHADAQVYKGRGSKRDDWS
jgi:V8-like Glu-specific endopeptidase